MEIGLLIREERIRNNLSQDDVAKAIGSTKQAVYKYENGIVTNIPLEKIEKMAQLFGVTPGYLMGWEVQTTEIETSALSEGDVALLKALDQLTDDEQKQVIEFAQFLISKRKRM